MEPAEAVLTWRDLAAVARRKAVHSRGWVLLAPLCLVFAALALLSPWVAVRVLSLLLAIYIGTVPFWGPTLATWLQARSRTWPDRPTTWTLTEAGVTVATEAGESTLPWTTLTGATSWRRGLSLTYGRAVAFIPVRGFRSDEQREAFLTSVESHLTH